MKTGSFKKVPEPCCNWISLMLVIKHFIQLNTTQEGCIQSVSVLAPFGQIKMVLGRWWWSERLEMSSGFTLLLAYSRIAEETLSIHINIFSVENKWLGFWKLVGL